MSEMMALLSKFKDMLEENNNFPHSFGLQVDTTDKFYTIRCLEEMNENVIPNGKAKFFLGDVVWVRRNGVVKSGQIRVAEYDGGDIKYRILVSGEDYSKEFDQDDVYESKDAAIAEELKTRRQILESELKSLKIDEDKIKRGLDIIFSKDETVDDEDFKELPQGDKPLEIPEHTSFWKSIWEHK